MRDRKGLYIHCTVPGTCHDQYKLAQFDKVNISYQISFYWLFPTVQLRGGTFRDKLILINLLNSARDHKKAVKYLIFSIYCWVYNNSVLGIMQVDKKKSLKKSNLSDTLKRNSIWWLNKNKLAKKTKNLLIFIFLYFHLFLNTRKECYITISNE